MGGVGKKEVGRQDHGGGDELLVLGLLVIDGKDDSRQTPSSLALLLPNGVAIESSS